MNLKDLQRLVGSEIPWKVQGVEVTVIIRDCRSVFGRLEVQIEPLSGSGEIWKQVDSLGIQEKEEGK